MNFNDKQLKNYDLLTIQLKASNLSKLSLNSAGSGNSSSDDASSSCRLSTLTSSSTNKIIKINDYDFAISGYCPSYVCNLNLTGYAYKCGLRNGDFIIKINNVNCCRATLKTIQKLLKKSSDGLYVTVYRLKTAASYVSENTAACAETTKKSTLSKIFKKKSSNNKKFKFSWLFTAAVPTVSCLHANQLNTTQASYYNLEQQPATTTTLSDNQHTESSLTNDIKKTGLISTDTGYETFENNEKNNSYNEISIDTITNTTNSYSSYDVTVSEVYNDRKRKRQSTTPQQQQQQQHLINQKRTNLIGNLIDYEIDFVDYLSNGVSTFSRPLRGFFIRQQDYFLLFQNIEKILVISENFLQSMQKWSAFDIYIHIGQFYNNKIKLLEDALKIYYKGYLNSKLLLNDLVINSKKFRSFLKETETATLNLNNFLDMPIIHFKKLIKLLKQIKNLTTINSNEYVNLENTANELKQLLSNVELNNFQFRKATSFFSTTTASTITSSEDYDDEDLTSLFETTEEATTFFENSYYQQKNYKFI